MLARYQQNGNDSSLSKEVNKARTTLKSLGWSYRSAADELGVHYVHLAKVLTGRRESKRLLTAIDALPPRAEVEAAA
jgi:hypothetical protein